MCRLAIKLDSLVRVSRRVGIAPYWSHNNDLLEHFCLTYENNTASSLNDFKSFNSLFKVLFTFPSRYLYTIGLWTYLALGGVYLPLWTAIPSCPTLRKVSLFPE